MLPPVDEYAGFIGSEVINRKLTREAPRDLPALFNFINLV
jgi:hypothetical protein